MSEPDADPITADDYLGFGLSLWLGAQAMDRGGDKDVVTMPFFLLIGFALEDALKAYLLHANVPEREWRSREKQHNLKALLDICCQHGLSIFDPRTVALIESLTDLHRRHQFRYPVEPARAELHTPLFALTMTEELIKDVADAIGYRWKE